MGRAVTKPRLYRELENDLAVFEPGADYNVLQRWLSDRDAVIALGCTRLVGSEGDYVTVAVTRRGRMIEASGEDLEKALLEAIAKVEAAERGS